ncbi:MAG: hypothetical protein EBX41_08890 [Chitinophagia bacterium]|nr:hypothetical protein [Chitinophagia bacterium]
MPFNSFEDIEKSLVADHTFYDKETIVAQLALVIEKLYKESEALFWQKMYVIDIKEDKIRKALLLPDYATAIATMVYDRQYAKMLSRKNSSFNKPSNQLDDPDLKW